MLDFLSLLWYVVVLTGGEAYEKYNQRTMARKHNSARGQQKQPKGDEGAWQGSRWRCKQTKNNNKTANQASVKGPMPSCFALIKANEKKSLELFTFL